MCVEKEKNCKLEKNVKSDNMSKLNHSVPVVLRNCSLIYVPNWSKNYRFVVFTSVKIKVTIATKCNKLFILLC